ncbi:MAG: type II and III secretion system protein family protein [Gemmatimonadota bacterium]
MPAHSRMFRAQPLRYSARLIPLVLGIAVYGLTQPAGAAGQAAVSGEGRTISLAKGTAQLVTHPVSMRRVSVSNAEVAEAVVVSPNELLLNGKEIGTTSLVIWDAEGRRTLYPVEVALDAASLENHFRALFPGEAFEVSSSGNVYILSGNVSNGTVAQRAVEIAEATGAMVVNNIAIPSPHQILLQVRFAEVSRTVMRDLAANFQRMIANDGGFITTGRFIPPPSGEFGPDPQQPPSTLVDAVNLLIFDLDDSKFAAFIRALKSTGKFRSLAEPNLLALDGKEASFLAGGEFPFPVVQGGSNNAVTIVFKEFGIRLNFTPTVTNSGNIHLKVAPEVSTLDFANGLQVSGFQIPAILSRRAETEVELRDGQTFAIAGLIDNSITDNVDKIPILGDLPILGPLFRSSELRQNRTELLVLVTPRLVQPSDEAPPIPPGEPDTWDWIEPLDEPVGQSNSDISND